MQKNIRPFGSNFTNFKALRPSKKTFTFLAILLFFVVLLKSATLQLNKGSSHIQSIFQTAYTTQFVERKADLLEVEISEQLKFQDWTKLGLEKSVKDYNFTKQVQLGFISNVNLNNLRELKRGNGNNDKNNNNNKPSLYNENQKLNEDTYSKIVECSDLMYNNTLEYYKFPTEMKIDFKAVRKTVLTANEPNAKEYTVADEKEMQEDEIISKRWFSFGAAPVWLESEHCYVSYTRVIYSKYSDRGWPYISIVYAQAYDKDWNELYNKRIFFRDVKMPQEVKDEVKGLKKELDSQRCNNVSKEGQEYQLCLANISSENAKLEERIEKIYDKYSIKYPTALKVPFDMEPIWNGPEDPHVILKKDAEGEEPIVIFNLKVGKPKKMFAIMPHRKTNQLVEFALDNDKLRGTEKNWAPFFYPNTKFSGDNSIGFIYFIYDFNPIEIIRCSLLSGHCSFIFKATTLDMERGDTHIFRGATQFVALPNLLPQVRDTNIWVGFVKEHIDRCGCSQKIYRPVLTVLVEKNGIYHFELITPNIDFNESVLSWGLKDYKCDDYNVLSPSSIANWFITSQDSSTKKFEDYLVLTISEADAVSKVTYIKGVLNYILGIYKDTDINETFELTSNSKEIIEKTAQCVFDSGVNYCKKYGAQHDDKTPAYMLDY